MRTYLIKITMPDGSRRRCEGIYADGFDAVIDIMTTFPTATRISARRVS